MKSNQHPNKNKIIVTLSTDCLIKINPILQVTDLKNNPTFNAYAKMFLFFLFFKINISSVHALDL